MPTITSVAITPNPKNSVNPHLTSATITLSTGATFSVYGTPEDIEHLKSLAPTTPFKNSPFYIEETTLSRNVAVYSEEGPNAHIELTPAGADIFINESPSSDPLLKVVFERDPVDPDALTLKHLTIQPESVDAVSYGMNPLGELVPVNTDD